MKSQSKTIEEQVKDALSDASYIAVRAANEFAGMSAAFSRAQIQDVAVLHSLLMIAGYGDGLRASIEAAMSQCVNVSMLPCQYGKARRQRMDEIIWAIKNELSETANALDVVQGIEGLDTDDIDAAVLSARQQCILMAGRLLSALQKP